MHRIRPLLLAVLLSAVALPLMARQPPKPNPVKYSPRQIAEAENLLERAACALNRQEPVREAWQPRPVRRPGELLAPVDLIGFPNDTSDNDLAKMLPYVKRLPGLQIVLLWNTDKVTAKGLKLLAKELPQLQGVIFKEFRIPDDAYSELAAFEFLQWVEIENCPIGDNGLRHISALPRLTRLSLIGNRNITADGLAHLAGATRLADLTVDVSASPAAMTAEVAKQKSVGVLHINPLTDDEAAELSKMSGLTSLDTGPLYGLTQQGLDEFDVVPNGFLTDSGLRSLCSLTHLTCLKLDGDAAVTVAGVKELATLESLNELELRNTGTTNAGLAVISRIKTLRTLDLSGTAITDVGLDELTTLPRLEYLTLSRTNIGNRAMRMLTNIRSLKSLVLNHTGISLLGEFEMDRLTSLRHIALRSTNIAPDSLPNLAMLKSASLIDLRTNTPNVTARNVGPLRAALPGCEVWADAMYAYGGSGVAFTFTWPGSAQYAFPEPEMKTPARTPRVMDVPIRNVPAPKGPPPKVAPVVPTRTGGSKP